MTETNRKVALVTGAARRIGAAIARKLHADGFDLALHYRNSGDDVQALASELEASRAGSVMTLQADLAEFDRLPEMVAKTIGRFGRLDALVNNASAFFPTPIGSVTPAQWSDLLDTNLRAPFFLAQAAAPHLRATRGAVVNLTDAYVRHPRADLSAYCASKAGLEGATRALAQALAPEVRVNAVAPGAILWPEDNADPQRQAALLARTPLARTGTPEEIAAVVAWLASSAASYVTGSVLRVDGGREA